MSDIQYWDETLTGEIDAIQKNMDELKQIEDNTEKAAKVEELERKCRIAMGTKRSYKLETRLVADANHRQAHEQRFYRLDQQLRQLATDFKAIKSEMDRGGLFYSGGPGEADENDLHAAGDRMLQEAAVLQEKTQGSLDNTKRMIAASKEVGAATLEELQRQRDVMTGSEFDGRLHPLRTLAGAIGRIARHLIVRIPQDHDASPAVVDRFFSDSSEASAVSEPEPDEASANEVNSDDEAEEAQVPLMQYESAVSLSATAADTTTVISNEDHRNEDGGFEMQDDVPVLTSSPQEQEENRPSQIAAISLANHEDCENVVDRSLLDPYGDRGNYTGAVLRSSGMPHGVGRMIYEENGRTYEGDWRHGRWHGNGQATFSNGDSYKGDYRCDLRHGRGLYRWKDGRVYDGEFKNDKHHGKGTFAWPDGGVYEGDFVNGKREGQGNYTFSDGGSYNGEWKNGIYHGFGTCIWEDGRRYQGEWKNGMSHGRGIETYPNGQVHHDGQWINGEPVH